MKTARVIMVAAAVAAATCTAAKGLSLAEAEEEHKLAPMSIRIESLPNIEVRAFHHCSPAVHHGIPAVTLEFENKATRERSFNLSASMYQSAQAVRKFSVEPGGVARFTIFLPLAYERGMDYTSRYWGDYMTVTETTPKANHEFAYMPLTADLAMPGNFENFSDSDPSLLLSAGISREKLQKDLTKAMRAGKHNSTHQRGTFRKFSYSSSSEKKEQPYGFASCQFKTESVEWPRDWRCYSTYDAVVATRREYDALPAEAKDALDAYRMLGGALLIVGGQDSFADDAEASRAIVAIDQACDALTGDLRLERYSYYYSSATSFADELRRIPIEAKSTLPVKTLMLVLAVFALAIVPIAVIRSVRRNARMRLLAILPGAAAVFALAIAIFAYAFFGTTPSVRLQSVTLLDQTAKKALTRGQFAVFSPVSLKNGLTLPGDAAFALRNAHGNVPPILDSAGEHRLVGGWTTPLVTSFFDFTRACERSERLDFRMSPAGDVTVVNLLGSKVSWGQANVGGALWSFRDVQPGGEAKAERLAETPDKDRSRQAVVQSLFGKSTTYGRDWDECVKSARDALRKMGDGEYIAEVEGSPFFPNPLGKRKSDSSESGLVYGWFREAAK